MFAVVSIDDDDYDDDDERKQEKIYALVVFVDVVRHK